MPSIAELRTKRTKAIADARAIKDKADKENKRDLTTEEAASVDAAIADVKKIDADIDKERTNEQRWNTLQDLEDDGERSSGRRTDDGDPEDDPEKRTDAPRQDRSEPRQRQSARARADEARELRWKAGRNERVIELRGRRASPEYRKAFLRYLMTGQQDQRLHAVQVEHQHNSWIGDAEARDLVADVDVQGGYLATPMQMAGGILQRVDDAVFMRQLATVYQIPTAQSLGEVSLDADPDEGDWTSELKTGTKDTGMAIGRRELNPAPLAKRILISNKLLRMVPGIESLVSERMAYRFGLAQERAFISGDGAKKPLGVFTANSAGISTARDVSSKNTAIAMTPDGLISAKMALKQQYRNAPTTRWLMHRDSVLQAMLFKDGNGQYMWRQGITLGDPDMLLNIPVLESEYCPNTFSTGKYLAVLGDFRFYHIADSLGLTMQRLIELYAEQNQIGFIGRCETDGMPVLEEAFVRVKLA